MVSNFQTIFSACVCLPPAPRNECLWLPRPQTVGFGALRKNRSCGDCDFFQHSKSGPQGGGLSWDPSYAPSPEQISPCHTTVVGKNSQGSLEHLLVNGLHSVSSPLSVHPVL